VRLTITLLRLERAISIFEVSKIESPTPMVFVKRGGIIER